MVTKAKLLGIALGTLIVLGGAGVARANDWYRGCGERIEHQQYKLDRAIAHHGYWSRQAEHERYELRLLRDECRYR